MNKKCIITLPVPPISCRVKRRDAKLGGNKVFKLSNQTCTSQELVASLLNGLPDLKKTRHSRSTKN